MKADYDFSRETISGKFGKFVLIRWKEGEKGVVRRFVKPKLGEQNQQFGSSLKNISSIWKECSSEYKNDLKIYADRFSSYYDSEEIPAKTNYAHFIRLVFRLKEINPEIDLSAISKEELETAGIPTNVKAIADNELLPRIAIYADLTNNW